MVLSYVRWSVCRVETGVEGETHRRARSGAAWPAFFAVLALHQPFFPASFSRASAICLSIQSWFRSSTARISEATTALRFRVSWLSCSDSPEIDQLVEPVTV